MVSRSRMLLWVVGAAGASLLVGLLVGTLVGLAYGLGGPPSDGWRDLAAFAMGLVTAVLAAGVAWLVLMTVVVRRSLPAGRRRPVLLWSLLALVAVPVVALVLLGVLPTGLQPSEVTQSVLLVAVVVGVVAPPVALLLQARPEQDALTPVGSP
jgi:hypothetical protein